MYCRCVSWLVFAALIYRDDIQYCAIEKCSFNLNPIEIKTPIYVCMYVCTPYLCR